MTVLNFGIKIRVYIIVKMENYSMFEIFIVDKIDIVVVMRVEDYGDSKFIEDKRTIKFNTINNKRRNQ